jgi:hypothetical protein
MTNANLKQIGDLTFHPDKPTEYSYTDLHAWVIWQFPRSEEITLPGAVHPPIARYGWLPARLQPYLGRVSIHAHHPQSYDSPEAAAAAI